MIRTENLSRSFGDLVALAGIDLRVEEGDLFGFVGPNGAGKTTTIRILTTLLEPSAGDAWIDGHSVWDDKDEIRGILGYMPDNFGVYRDMTVVEYLHFFAAAYGVPHRARGPLVDGLLELTDLGGRREALIDTLSRGMQQRLGLARTLVHDPKVLVLDEPASGLDPRARVEMRGILEELRRMGKTILLSSHILSEIAEICNRIAILERGRLVAQGTLDDVVALARDEAEIWVGTDDDARAAVVLRELPAVIDAERAEHRPLLRVRLGEPLDLAALTAHLVRRDIGVRHLQRQEPTLEQVYMKLTKGLVQ